MRHETNVDTAGMKCTHVAIKFNNCACGSGLLTGRFGIKYSECTT